MIQGRQASCSSGCQWLCNGGMWSPSAALSPPNKGRCGHFAYITISSAYWLCAGGLKIIIILLKNRLIEMKTPVKEKYFQVSPLRVAQKIL